MITPSQRIIMIIAAIFITSLVLADIIGSKLIVVGPFPVFGVKNWTLGPLILSAGILPFPITFVLTDLINEFYGKKTARFITFVGLGMAVFTYFILLIARYLPASENSPLSQEIFNTVFGLSNRMFIASLAAYLVGQLLDIQVFHTLRHITKEKMLWLRATGSTVVSQLVDSGIVTLIAFSGKIPLAEIVQVATNNYGVKFVVALALTPFCYLGHEIIYRTLGASPQPLKDAELSNASTDTEAAELIL